MEKLGPKMLLSEHMPNTVTSVFIPNCISVKDFLDAMQEYGYTLYLGKGKYLNMGMFQIANMGDISLMDCRAFLHVLTNCLHELGYRVS